MVSFPYYSHIFKDSYGNGVGIVWEAYHKGVPLLGVPGITLDISTMILARVALEYRVATNRSRVSLSVGLY